VRDLNFMTASKEQSRLSERSNRLLLPISYVFLMLAAFLMLTDFFRILRPPEPGTESTKPVTVVRAASHRKLNYGMQR